jgi:hypothetical protein
MVLPSFSPRSVRFVESRVRKRRRTWRDERPPPDSDPLNDGEFGKNLGCLSTKFAANRESLIQVRRTQSAFHSAHTGSVDYRIPAVQGPFIGPEKR